MPTIFNYPDLPFFAEYEYQANVPDPSETSYFTDTLTLQKYKDGNCRPFFGQVRDKSYFLEYETVIYYLIQEDTYEVQKSRQMSPMVPAIVNPVINTVPYRYGDPLYPDDKQVVLPSAIIGASATPQEALEEALTYKTFGNYTGSLLFTGNITSVLVDRGFNDRFHSFRAIRWHQCDCYGDSFSVDCQDSPQGYCCIKNKVVEDACLKLKG